MQGVIFTVGLGVELVLSAYQAIYHQGSPSDISTLIYFWIQLQSPLNILGYSFNYLHSSFIEAERMLKLLLEKPVIKDKADAKELVVTRGEIEFDHVNFSYDIHSTSMTLKDLTFRVLPGQTVALVGGSGVGKSTVLRLLDRLYNIKSGLISIDGQDINEVTVKSLRSIIGIVPQVIAPELIDVRKWSCLMIPSCTTFDTVSRLHLMKVLPF